MLKPDRLLAVAIFLTLGAIYVATLLPGLGGTEDTAKFQYVGPALGTAHDPGYPLYMIASWAASKLPIGTLAYRVNLLSGFWGAAAAAFVFLVMRRLAVPRALAVGVALGLGLGRAFWEHSTYAEVYTQACAFTAAALVALLAWDEEGRDRDLFAAVAATSLAFGTHLIVIGAVPVFAWLALTRYRWRLPLRVVAVSGLIVALGVAQYSYVWIRTGQRARYLEARASSVRELIDTLRGGQFADQTFKDSPLVIARTRIPGIARAVRTELGVVATAGALLGVLAEWRRRRRSAILLAGAFLGPALLLSTLGGVATEGIILPALMPLWALVGAGAARLWLLAASLARPRVARVAAFAAVALLTAAVPATQARANFTYNNRRGDSFDTVYFAELFRRITGRTAFLDENYVVGNMLEYQKYITRMPDVTVGIPRDPHVITTLLSAGFAVYGFSDAVAELDGRVSVRPVALSAASLDARLAGLPDGYLVVVAGSAQRWPLLEALDAGDRAPRRGRGVVVALKGSGPVVKTPPDFEGAIDITRGQPLGQTGETAAMDLHVEVRGPEATIDVEGQTVVQSTGGLAVAVMGSRVGDTYVLSPGNGLRPPLDMSRRPLFQVTGVPDGACTEIGDGQWARLADPGSAGRLVGHIDNFHPFDAEWVVYLAADHELHAQVASWFGANEPALDVEAFVPGPDAERLRPRLAEDGLEASPQLLSAPVVTRLGVKVNDEGQWISFRLSLGGRPRAGWGRAITDQRSLRRGISCALAPDLLEPHVWTQRAGLYLGPGGDWLFGLGWQSAESMRVGFHRVLRGAEGRLLLPVTQPAPTTLRMSVEPISGDADVAVSLNGGAPVQASRVATPGWNELWWTLDAAQWRAGVNDLALEVMRPAGRAPAADEPSLRVRAIELDWSIAR
jgi:transmembrane protein TMEM260 (protein O-mannosyltransferase)